MGIHQKFFEQPYERSQFEVNRDFRGIMAHLFSAADATVYENVFAMRDVVHIVPVQDAPFDWELDDLDDEDDWDFPPNPPIGWDSA